MGKYSKNNLEKAIDAVRTKNMVRRGAAVKYSFPRFTLQLHLKNTILNSRPGLETVLTSEEEQILVKWLARKNPLAENMPGRGWYRSFSKRHPNISMHTLASVTFAIACVAPKNIQG